MQREPIYAALFELAWDGPTFKNPKETARILRHWNEVAPEEHPAFFMAQGRETVSQTAANGLPTKWLLEASLYIYVIRDGDRSPGEVINPILDVISSKLEATARGTPQTLGSLVEWARIEGTIETSEGTLGDREIAIVPVRILTA